MNNCKNNNHYKLRFREKKFVRTYAQTSLPLSAVCQMPFDSTLRHKSILQNELGKRDKMRGLHFISFLASSLLDSIYQITLKLLKNCIFTVKTSDLPSFPQHYNERHRITLLNM